MSAPLAGVRVLELATYITGPYAGLLLADLGAEVIKIEAPKGGDPFRIWAGGTGSPRFRAFNRGKRSVALDLRSLEGQQLLRRVAERSDVLIENFRPGVADRLGVGYDAISEVNPRLIYCSISGLGPDGPAAALPTYDAVGQAMSGLMSLLTDMSDPKPVGPALCDSLSGLFAAYAILAALRQRDATGRGQHVETSMLQATLGFLIEPATHLFATGEVPDETTRARQSQSYAFTASDGKCLVVHLSTPTKFWLGLLRAVGRTDLTGDPRFAGYGDRIVGYDAIVQELSPVFRARPRADWLERLAAEDVPAAPIHTIAEALADPQARHLGLEVQLPASDGLPPDRTIARPVRLQDLPPIGREPQLGADTAAVLRELGIADPTLESLQATGVALVG